MSEVKINASKEDQAIIAKWVKRFGCSRFNSWQVEYTTEALLREADFPDLLWLIMMIKPHNFKKASFIQAFKDIMGWHLDFIPQMESNHEADPEGKVLTNLWRRLLRGEGKFKMSDKEAKQVEEHYNAQASNQELYSITFWTRIEGPNFTEKEFLFAALRDTCHEISKWTVHLDLGFAMQKIEQALHQMIKDNYKAIIKKMKKQLSTSDD